MNLLNVSRMSLVVMACFSTVACGQCDYVPMFYEAAHVVGLCEGLKSAPEKSAADAESAAPILSVGSTSMSGDGALSVAVTNASDIDSAILKRDTLEIPLTVFSKSQGEIKLRPSSGISLAAGIWTLMVRTAHAQASQTLYLAAEDNSITSTKIVSLDAT